MKLMERVKATMRVKRYSLRTEKTYCYWIRFYIRFNNLRHPATLTGHEVRQFLEYLAIEGTWRQLHRIKHSTPSSFLVVHCFHSRPPLCAQ